MCLFIIPHVISESLPCTTGVPGQCGSLHSHPAGFATQDPLAEASADVVDTGSLEGGCPAKGRQPQPHGTGPWTHKLKSLVTGLG